MERIFSSKFSVRFKYIALKFRETMTGASEQYTFPPNKDRKSYTLIK